MRREAGRGGRGKGKGERGKGAPSIVGNSLKLSLSEPINALLIAEKDLRPLRRRTFHNLLISAHRHEAREGKDKRGGGTVSSNLRLRHQCRFRRNCVLEIYRFLEMGIVIVVMAGVLKAVRLKIPF
jgi:hypothetical protein